MSFKTFETLIKTIYMLLCANEHLIRFVFYFFSVSCLPQNVKQQNELGLCSQLFEESPALVLLSSSCDDSSFLSSFSNNS